MALYHFSAQMIGRGAGRSAVRAAAYRHSARMVCEHEGTTINYAGRQPIAHAELTLPDDTPKWLRTLVDGRTPAKASEAFWNEVELFEKRIDAQLARELNIALPVELTREQNIAMVREFVQEQYTSRGMVVDWVYHDKAGNPHIHLMHTLRPLAEQGFGGKKVAVLESQGNVLRGKDGKIIYQLWAGSRDRLVDERLAWAEKQNYHLSLHGYEARVDARSYEDQGIAIAPTSHLGVHANGMKIRTDFTLDRRVVHDGERAINAARIAEQPSIVLDLITREKSVFTNRDVARVLFRFIDNREQFQTLQLRVGTSDELVPVCPEIFDPESNRIVQQARYTTRAMLELEHRMIEKAAALVSSQSFATANYHIERAFADRSFLSDEQRHAVEHVTSPSGISVVVGYAGAGKSTMLDAARAAWEGQGFRVYGAALAGKATEGLQENSGIKSRTIAAWEMRWNSGVDNLKAGDVFVLDEAGLVSANQMARLVSAADAAGAKLVLVGDWQQLQAIEAGSPFRAIAEKVGYVELIGIRRQRIDWQREASIQFARGEVIAALQAYHDKGHVVIAGNGDDAKTALIENWHKSDSPLSEKLIMASTNADMSDLNSLAREALKADRLIGPEALFRTERGARSFGANDRVLFLQNAKIAQNQQESVSVKNGMLGTVIEAAENALVVRLDRGDTVHLSADQYNNIDHGYAVTVHKAQGVTVDHAWLYASSMMDAHSTYVGMTRHRDSAMLYAGADSFSVKGIGELMEHGVAPYEHKPENKQSYYVTLANAKGKERTIWGVDLERALQASGAAIGDKIGLEHLGVQPVTLPDGKTVERNEWRVNTAAELAPEKLFEALGRQRLKEATTDYAKHEDYRDAVSAFAERRGFDTWRTLKPLLDSIAQKARIVTAHMRESFGKLAGRFENVTKVLRKPTQQAGLHATKTYPALFAAVGSFGNGVQEQAKINALDDRQVIVHTDDLMRQLARVYKEPESAMQKITHDLQSGRTTLTDNLQQKPTVYGELRGSPRWLDGRKARQERSEAQSAIVSAVDRTKSYSAVYNVAYNREYKAEIIRRESMMNAVPGMSKEAFKLLRRLDKVSTKSPDQFEQRVLDVKSSNPHLYAELEQLAKAINQRFGDKAFESTRDQPQRRVEPSDQRRLQKVERYLRTVQRVDRVDISRTLQQRPPTIQETRQPTMRR
jgi:Ti-type conjugative transfer relaxase TraA